MNLDEFKTHQQEIFDEVSQIVEAHYVFKRLRELLEPNIKIVDNIFFDHYVISHAASMASSIRRQNDKKASRGGLGMFLTNLLPDTALITKEDYLKPFQAGGLTHEGERIWSERYGGKDTLDPEVVKVDIALLDETTKNIKDFVDKNIAHRDKDAHLYTTVWGEIDTAVKTIENLVIKYYTLIVSVGSGMEGLLAGNIDGWENIFNEAWVK